MAWWRVSDNSPTQMRMCETMGRIMCHASRLKCDDVRLKSLSPSHRMCSECDMYVVENIYHLVMQCPIHEGDRVLMYDALYNYDPQLRGIFRTSPEKILFWLLGMEINDTSEAYVTTAYVIITVYVIFNRLRNKKSTAYVITTASVIKI